MIVGAVIVAVAVVTLLTRYPGVALALTAVGTVGAAAAAAYSARQSAESAHESASSSRATRRELALPRRPRLKLSGRRTPDGSVRLNVEISGTGEYREPRVQYLKPPGSPARPILDGPLEWESQAGDVVVDAGVGAVRFVLSEGVTGTRWQHDLVLEHLDEWQYRVGMELAD